LAVVKLERRGKKQFGEYCKLVDMSLLRRGYCQFEEAI